MKLHRFYVGDRHPRDMQHFGRQRMWLQDAQLLHQWRNVLRLREGEQVVLFDETVDLLYRIEEWKPDEVALEKVTEMTRCESSGVLLAWSLLKSDKNDFVLQKGTELGITRFVPLVTDRVEKVGFDTQRAERIVIEAAEQSSRSDVPFISEPVSLKACLEQYGEHYQFYAAHIGHHATFMRSDKTPAICIGPEGGWSEREIELFESQAIPFVSLSPFVLRAETAAIVAATLLQ